MPPGWPLPRLRGYRGAWTGALSEPNHWDLCVLARAMGSPERPRVPEDMVILAAHRQWGWDGQRTFDFLRHSENACWVVTEGGPLLVCEEEYDRACAEALVRTFLR